MSDRMRSALPSPAMVVALIALAIALSGTAYAATTIGTKQIKDGAVTTPKLHDGAVTAAKLANGAVTAQRLRNDAVTAGKVKDGSLLAADFRPGELTKAPGPQGPAGPQGPPGAPGPPGLDAVADVEQVLGAQSSLPAGDVALATVDCDSAQGEIAISGGAYQTAVGVPDWPSTAGGGLRVIAQFPYAYPGGDVVRWNVVIENPTLSAHTYRAFALCLQTRAPGQGP